MVQNRTIIIVRACLLSLILTACANRGSGPTGGEKDITPPMFLKSNPVPNETEFKKSKMIIEFDEYIELQGQSEKVIVSPPQIMAPIIRASGKKIVVELRDQLKDSTTYVIDFADAIKDNNEGNKLSNFVLAFSTGKTVDTMEISGRIYQARDLEPEKYVLVGVHRSMDDSCFTNQPFERVTRSNEFGFFTLKNLSPGKYRVFALKEADNNFRFNTATEDYAFLDSMVLTTVGERIVNDTLRIMGTKHDTIISRVIPDYSPKNLFLKTSNEGFKNLYLESNERKQANKLSLYFTAPMDSLPKVRLLNHDLGVNTIVERSITNDTIHYWLTDSALYNLDSLVMEARYLKHDTSLILQPTVDTLYFTYEKPVVKEIKSKSRRNKKEKETPQIIFMGVTNNASSNFFIENPFEIIFNEPIMSFDPQTTLFLYSKRDTLWDPMKFRVQIDSINPRRVLMEANWDFGGEYKVRIDSATLFSYTGLFNNKMEATIRVNTEDTYANLFFNLSGVSDSAFVELLNASDKVVRIQPVRQGQAEFFYLNPGKYGARIIIDRNGNGVWDPAKFAERRQAEPVIYYPQILDLRANSDYEQSWDINLTPLELQKPKLLIKNKPKEENVSDSEEEIDDNDGLPEGFRQF